MLCSLHDRGQGKELVRSGEDGVREMNTTREMESHSRMDLHYGVDGWNGVGPGPGPVVPMKTPLILLSSLFSSATSSIICLHPGRPLYLSGPWWSRVRRQV